MISLIAAVARNGVIGDGNSLIWHISEDLKHFKRVTMGCPVIMGRKTFESLGRALPGRTNVVITRSVDYCAEGCRMAHSLDEALSFFADVDEVFIIGGGDIYRQALPLADRMYLTVVDKDYSGDTHFPKWDSEQWIKTSEERYERGEKFEYPFTFLSYSRKK